MLTKEVAMERVITRATEVNSSNIESLMNRYKVFRQMSKAEYNSVRQEIQSHLGIDFNPICGSLNIEDTLAAFQQCMEGIQIKECYTNVFCVFNHFFQKFRDGYWRVAYGYVKIFLDKPLYCRHCFILDKDNRVIDVTLPALLRHRGELDLENETTFSVLEQVQKDSSNYLVMKVFDKPNEYLNAIENENLFPALTSTLMSEEIKMGQWAMLHNLMLCG